MSMNRGVLMARGALKINFGCWWIQRPCSSSYTLDESVWVGVVPRLVRSQ